ncbi:NNMT/PNMT/TEMT family class I SAM-dependent methyltransferase [Streptomyces guryensis]|uniref:NNMT/PNMT/TEMT family class I SAM-dependent methyltransferase n=1 Tax=Streptomyces guryensis TaxID=2886947 RepID=A0A9Q3Z8V6_9ACTN|nr:NNMT/PNMT/TEMT family class I SAM-dependent methyltransferase [Streptomyces guryensis]MCD9877709.1 NNMT/PNMT/TEMT family class I SAM-dependent methyltransferase [Streptomyces guryensis]
MATHNDDVDWDSWPVADYLAENYRDLHPSDAAVITHHSAFYRRLAPGSVDRSVEFGAGPNLYPLILAAAASRRIEAVEAGTSNVAYLERQILCGPDASWRPFHALCRRLNPDLPATLAGALAHVNVVHADVRELEPAGYDLASMHFVAEGATEDYAEFTDFCRAFVRCVVPGGHLVAAFMENMPTYRIGPVSRWPGCPVDPEIVTRVFTPMTRDLSVNHIDTDPTLPDYGDSGMVLLTAVAR